MPDVGDFPIRSCNCTLPYHECCGRIAAPPWQVFTSNGTNVTTCTHCYCQEVNVNGVEHKVCCNCGNKQAGSVLAGGTHI